MPDSDAHLDVLALDALRASEPGPPEAAAHLAGCATCRVRLDELAALATALKDQHAVAVDAAPGRDAQILWMARGHAARLRQLRRRSPLQRWVAAPATWALAATVLLAFASLLLLARRHAPQPPQQLVQVAPAPPLHAAGPIDPRAADLDGDGRVTVLDAFALARALKTGGGSGAVDLTRDARTDDDDVNAVLAMAVSVKGG